MALLRHLLNGSEDEDEEEDEEEGEEEERATSLNTLDVTSVPPALGATPLSPPGPGAETVAGASLGAYVSLARRARALGTAAGSGSGNGSGNNSSGYNNGSAASRLPGLLLLLRGICEGWLLYRTHTTATGEPALGSAHPRQKEVQEQRAHIIGRS